MCSGVFLAIKIVRRLIIEGYGVNAKIYLASYAAHIVNAQLSADTQRKYLAIAQLFVDYLCDREMYDLKFFTKVTVIDFSKYLDDSSTRKLYTEKSYHYAAKRYLKYIFAMRGERCHLFQYGALLFYHD